MAGELPDELMDCLCEIRRTLLDGQELSEDLAGRARICTSYLRNVADGRECKRAIEFLDRMMFEYHEQKVQAN